MSIPISALNFQNAVYYHINKFPPAALNYGLLVEPLARAVNAIARFDQMLKNMHNSDFLLAPLRKQEAIISSRMEGTVSTMDEILRYEADYTDEGDSETTGYRPDVIETIMYQRALRTAQQEIEGGRNISEWLIRSMHSRLLFIGRGAQKSPGEYKTEQNYVVDRTKRNVLFVPIGPELLSGSMQNLIKYIDESPEQILIKTAIAHVEFESLHPFKDGNGRLGRMIITLMLWQAGVISAPHFYISSYFEENKDLYIDQLKSVSKNDSWTEWCIFFLDAVEKQATQNLQIAEEISNLYNEMKKVFENKLGTRWHLRALDFVFTNPYFRNNNFTKKSGIPERTAAKFAHILLKEGLLVTLEEASGRRAALYAFDPLRRLVRV